MGREAKVKHPRPFYRGRQGVETQTLQDPRQYQILPQTYRPREESLKLRKLRVMSPGQLERNKDPRCKLQPVASR